MMALLARGLSWLVGSNILAPLSMLAALTFAHQAWLARDARLEAAGTRQCEAHNSLALVAAQRNAALAQAAQSADLLQQERKINEELTHERDKIVEDYRLAKAAASSDPRCLSDGVLDLLRGTRHQ